jgi:hypothetical protein
MTELLPELDGLPSGVFDGELVAFEDGLPSFRLVCEQAAGNIVSPPLA